MQHAFAFVFVLVAVATAVGTTPAAALDPNYSATNPAEIAVAANTPQQPLLSPKSPAPSPDWGVLVFGGASAGRTRLIELIPMPWSGHYGDHYFAGGALSRRLAQPDPYWSIEGEIGAGYRFKQSNTPEGWIALFLRFHGFPWNHVVYTTVALNTGLSYVTTVPDIEKESAAERGHPDGSRLLHYLAPEFTFADPAHRDWELVVRFHHRSGVFGLFNGVWGGSNVVTGGIRHRF